MRTAIRRIQQPGGLGTTICFHTPFATSTGLGSKRTVSTSAGDVQVPRVLRALLHRARGRLILLPNCMWALPGCGPNHLCTRIARQECRLGWQQQGTLLAGHVRVLLGVLWPRALALGSVAHSPCSAIHFATPFHTAGLIQSTGAIVAYHTPDAIAPNGPCMCAIFSLLLHIHACAHSAVPNSKGSGLCAYRPHRAQRLFVCLDQ